MSASFMKHCKGYKKHALVLIITEQEIFMCMQTKPTENTCYDFLLLGLGDLPKADTNVRYTFRMMKHQAASFLKILS